MNPEESLDKALQLILEALERLQYTHRHKTPLGGCDECRMIAKMTMAAQEIENAKATK